MRVVVCLQVCVNSKVTSAVAYFTLHSVPEGVSSAVHKTKYCCAHRWKNLFNPFTPRDFLPVCVHWTLRGSKYFLWDCTHWGQTGGLCVHVHVFVCMCWIDRLDKVTCFVRNQSTRSLTMGRKWGWLPFDWAFYLSEIIAIGYLWHAAWCYERRFWPSGENYCFISPFFSFAHSKTVARICKPTQWFIPSLLKCVALFAPPPPPFPLFFNNPIIPFPLLKLTIACLCKTDFGASDLRLQHPFFFFFFPSHKVRQGTTDRGRGKVRGGEGGG